MSGCDGVKGDEATARVSKAIRGLRIGFGVTVALAVLGMVIALAATPASDADTSDVSVVSIIGVGLAMVAFIASVFCLVALAIAVWIRFRRRSRLARRDP